MQRRCTLRKRDLDQSWLHFCFSTALRSYCFRSYTVRILVQGALILATQDYPGGLRSISYFTERSRRSEKCKPNNQNSGPHDLDDVHKPSQVHIKRSNVSFRRFSAYVNLPLFWVLEPVALIWIADFERFVFSCVKSKVMSRKAAFFCWFFCSKMIVDWAYLKFISQICRRLKLPFGHLELLPCRSSVRLGRRLAEKEAQRTCWMEYAGRAASLRSVCYCFTWNFQVLLIDLIWISHSPLRPALRQTYSCSHHFADFCSDHHLDLESSVWTVFAGVLQDHFERLCKTRCSEDLLLCIGVSFSASQSAPHTSARNFRVERHLATLSRTSEYS